jgi:lipopolysaccharide export system protein LptA
MNKTLRFGGLGVLVALLGLPAHAEKADRDKPMNVEANALRYDDAKQVSVFSGQVILTKGTILIRGGKMDVRQDPEGYQYGVVTAEPGRLAFFRQKREGVDETIEGEGEIIDYDGRADTVKFIAKAQLRRYRGAVLNDEFNAGIIVYNNTTDVFTLDGASGAGKSGSNGQPGAPAGRVRAMLTPNTDKSTSTPLNTSTKISPALRETSTLSPGKP